jgi:glycosyltransferase involved in cell wall biosynthesis
MHVLCGLRIGGKERVALDLARQGRRQGQDHTLLLYDHPFRRALGNFDPGDVPWRFLGRRPGLDLRFAWRLGRVITEAATDVVHAHNETAITYAALSLAMTANRRTRLIGTYHTWPTSASIRARLLARSTAARCAAVVAVSDDLAQRLMQGGWTEPCGVVLNGVAPTRPSSEASASRRSARPTTARRIVLNIGRCDPIKGQADLIAAADLVHRAHPDAVFVIAGDGPALADLRARAKARPYVRCVGAIRDTASFLERAVLFVLSSHDEGSPLALLEAMSSGCAIVATDVGGVRRMLADAGPPAGVLVPPRDPAALAAAISALLSDRDRAAAFADIARMRAGDFSAQRMWQEYRQLYETGAAR